MVPLYHDKEFFLCTHFPPTFQKLFQNSSVRVPLRFQKFFKVKGVRVPKRTNVRKIEQNFKRAFYYISNAHIF